MFLNIKLNKICNEFDMLIDCSCVRGPCNGRRPPCGGGSQQQRHRGQDGHHRSPLRRRLHQAVPFIGNGYTGQWRFACNFNCKRIHGHYYKQTQTAISDNIYLSLSSPLFRPTDRCHTTWSVCCTCTAATAGRWHTSWRNSRPRELLKSQVI